MLAIQAIRLQWTKNERNPKAAALRRTIGKPEKLEHSFISNGENCFLNRKNYIQNGFELSLLKSSKEILNADQGTFYQTPDAIRIPSIQIFPVKNTWQIRWFSESYSYRPIRKGYNEYFYDRHSEFCGKALCNEKAFTLKIGESGKIRYNYRITGYHGWYYEMYYLYFVYTDNDVIEENIFTNAEYDYTYEQMADLF